MTPKEIAIQFFIKSLKGFNQDVTIQCAKKLCITSLNNYIDFENQLNVHQSNLNQNFLLDKPYTRISLLEEVIKEIEAI